MAKKKTSKRKAPRKGTTTKTPRAARRGAASAPGRASGSKVVQRAVRGTKAANPQRRTSIERVFKGKKHVVKVAADGFVHGRKTYPSLTAVAKAITKYPSISGPRFFGTDAGAQKKGG